MMLATIQKDKFDDVFRWIDTDSGQEMYQCIHQLIINPHCDVRNESYLLASNISFDYYELTEVVTSESVFSVTFAVHFTRSWHNVNST